MTAPVLWYVNGLKAALDAVLGLVPVSGTPTVILLSDTYVIDQDAHAFVSDIIAHEAAGTGYTAGGNALTGVTTAADGPSNTASWDADDVTGINVTCCYAVLCLNTGVQATSPLLNIADLGGGTDTIITGFRPNSSGVAGITAA